MPEIDIDLERVISDPAYRRAVLDYLKNEDDTKAEARVVAYATETPARPDASSK